jgi:hypothetical protein
MLPLAAGFVKFIKGLQNPPLFLDASNVRDSETSQQPFALSHVSFISGRRNNTSNHQAVGLDA